MLKKYMMGAPAILLMSVSHGALAQTVPQPTEASSSTSAQTATAAAGATPGAIAQTMHSDTGLAEIVVSARKVSENLQRAPASIVAVDGNALSQRGITDLQSLEKVLPSANLRMQSSIVQVYIRGIGTKSDVPNFAGASALTYNGLIIQRYGTFGLNFDLDRVESIAGPQGTLYGGSAAGGAVNLFSTRPRSDFSGNASIAVTTYAGVHASAAQDIPISDTLSARAAATYNRSDSYFTNNVGNENNYGVRGSLLWAPSQNFSTNLFFNHVGDTGKPISTLVQSPFAFPGDPYRLPTVGVAGNPIDGKYTNKDNRSDIVGANVNLTLGNSTFTYIPGYVDFSSHILRYSGLTGRLNDVLDAEKQHSEELRWNMATGPLHLSAGLFYLRNQVRFNVALVNFKSPTQTIRTVSNNTPRQVNLNEAAYGQAVLDISSWLRLTAGGRVSYDKIDASGTGSGGVAFDFHHDHTRLDYKVGLDFDLAPRVLGYLNLQSGYIPFGYNPDVKPTPIVPESKLTAYSGGVKSRLFDNRVELNAEAFYYYYQNFQAIQFVNATATSTVLNAPKSTILGIDVSVRANVTPTIQFTLGAVIQRARYDRFSGPGYNYSGNQMINAPDGNIEAGLQKTFHLGDGGDIIAEGNLHWESGHYGGFENFLNAHQPAYTKSDLSLTYVPPSDRWRIQLFVQNVENTAVFGALSPGTTAASPASGSLDAPRIFGARLSGKW